MKPFNSFVEWAKANAHPVSSASEDNAEELSFLKSALADARVVSLGEFQHYTGVFNAFHFKLFRYLVEIPVPAQRLYEVLLRSALKQLFVHLSAVGSLADSVLSLNSL